MIQVRRMGHATFETTQLDNAIAYYTVVLGLNLVAKEPGAAYLATSGGLLSVVLTQSGNVRCAGLSFEVDAGADLAAACRELAEEGIGSELRSDPAPGLAKVLSLSDPNGTQINLFTTPVMLPPRDGGGVKPLKLGHIAFYTPDPDLTLKFYQQHLGFRVSDWIEDFFVFMRCNADHHTVNFLRGDKPRMHHIAFELKDVAHISNSCDVLTKHQIPLVWGPLRLGPGHNIAAFHREHDGQLVEFYTELDQMKDEVLGYYDPRPWHRDAVQRPKVWQRNEDPIWGPPPPPSFL